MAVVVTTGAISRAKLQSNHHHQQNNIQFFYRPDVLPVAQPTVSKHWMEIDIVKSLKMLFIILSKEKPREKKVWNRMLKQQT